MTEQDKSEMVTDGSILAAPDLNGSIAPPWLEGQTTEPVHSSTADTKPNPVPVVKKRTRRTKAQMAEAKAGGVELTANPSSGQWREAFADAADSSALQQARWKDQQETRLGLKDDEVVTPSYLFRSYGSLAVSLLALITAVAALIK